MGQYAGNNVWQDEVYQFEETDVVQGGADGIDNVPLKDLADRTAYLKNQIGLTDRLYGEVSITSNSPINTNNAGKLNVVYASNIITLTLAAANTFKHGAIIPVLSFCAAEKVVNIQTSGGEFFTNPVDGNFNLFHAHNGENVTIIALTDHFRVIYGYGNFLSVGEEITARKILRNTLAFTGQLVSRTAYPRLTKYVLNELVLGHEVIPDSLWLTDTITYRGFFSTGDGSTTIRLPDERGMFERMLDLGRGLDLSRLTNYAGGYEIDQVKSHQHDVDLGNSFVGNPAPGDDKRGGRGAQNPNKMKTDFFGGTENTVKNIGKYRLIKF